MDDTKVTLVGRVGRDPERRSTNGGELVHFSLAVSTRVQDASGAWHDGPTSWYTVNVWRELGQNAAASISKGQRVVVHGVLSVRDYQTQDGRKGREVEVRAAALGHDLAFGTSRFERVLRTATTAPAQEGVQEQEQRVQPDRSGEWTSPGAAGLAEEYETTPF